MINKNSKGKQNSKFGYASKRPYAQKTFFLLGSYQEDKAIIIFFPPKLYKDISLLKKDQK